jgi:hypothetical protein
MQLRRLAVLSCLLSSLSAFAEDDDWVATARKRSSEDPAAHYTGDLSVSMLSGTGVSMYGGGAYGSGGNVTLIAAGYQQSVTLGLGFDLRIVTHGFLVDVGLGGAYGLGAFGGGGGGGVLMPSLGLGFAAATSPNFALSPMVRGTLTFGSGLGALIAVGGELPMTFFIGRHGFMEPFIFLGVLTSSMGGAIFSGSLGYRLGVTF